MPHGNSKSGQSFYPTLPSTMQQIKEECSKGSGPKQAVSDVSARMGGVISATDACEIPHNEQQVTKLKRRMKYSGYSDVHPSCEQSDELASSVYGGQVQSVCPSHPMLS